MLCRKKVLHLPPSHCWVRQDWDMFEALDKSQLAADLKIDVQLVERLFPINEAERYKHTPMYPHLVSFQTIQDWVVLQRNEPFTELYDAMFIYISVEPA